MKAISRQWLERLPAPQGALETVQEYGRNLLLNIGLPNNKLEAWRFTNTTHLENLVKLPLVQERDEITTIESSEWADKSTNSFRIILNQYSQISDQVKLPKGIRKLSSQEIKKHIDHLPDENLSHEDWAWAMNYATTSQILALHVDGQDLPTLEVIMPAIKDTLSSTRLLIVLDKCAKLELLQIALGSGNSAQSHLLEIHLGENSELNHGYVALGGGGASCLSNLAIKQEKGSDYALTMIQKGWCLSRIEPRIIQLNGKSKTSLKGLQISTEKEQVATHSLVRFDGPEGYLNQLQKAAACKRSHSIFNGAISVPKIAQKTNASQLSRNLLLSDLARIDTKPELEIVADDVKCSHGATVSQLQKEELFYMLSRGISSEQATSLLLKGYCQEIINSLPIEAGRWKILDKMLHNIKS